MEALSCTNRPPDGGVLVRSVVRGHPVVGAVWRRTASSDGATARAVAKAGVQVVVEPDGGGTEVRPAGHLGELRPLAPLVLGFDLHPWVDRLTVERFDGAVHTATRTRVRGRHLVASVLAVSGDWSERSDLREIVELVGAPQRPGARSAGPAIAARTQRRRLSQATGLSPDRLRVLVRVGRVRSLLREPTASIAGVAARVGYVDQSHLHREFVRWSGCTPGAWRARSTGWQLHDGVDRWDDAPAAQRSWSP